MEENILKLLRRKKNISLTSIEINNFLGLNGVEEYNELEKTLNKLCREGKIYYSEKKKRYTPIENTNYVTGKLIVNSKGYGFVIVDSEDFPEDIYIKGINLMDGRNNDLVLVDIINRKANEGKITRNIN